MLVGGRLVNTIRFAVRLLPSHKNWDIWALCFLMITFQGNACQVLEKDMPRYGKKPGEDLHLRERGKELMMASFLK